MIQPSTQPNPASTLTEKDKVQEVKSGVQHSEAEMKAQAEKAKNESSCNTNNKS